MNGHVSFGSEKTVLSPPGASCRRHCPGGTWVDSHVSPLWSVRTAQVWAKASVSLELHFLILSLLLTAMGQYSQFWSLKGNSSSWQWLTNHPIPGAGEQMTWWRLHGGKHQAMRSNVHSLEPEIHWCRIWVYAPQHLHALRHLCSWVWPRLDTDSLTPEQTSWSDRMSQNHLQSIIKIYTPGLNLKDCNVLGHPDINERHSNVMYHIQFHKEGGILGTVVIPADVHDLTHGAEGSFPRLHPNSCRNQLSLMACPYQQAWLFDVFFSSSCCQDNLFGLYPCLLFQSSSPPAFCTLLFSEISPCTIAIYFQMHRCDF